MGWGGGKGTRSRQSGSLKRPDSGGESSCCLEEALRKKNGGAIGGKTRRNAKKGKTGQQFTTKLAHQEKTEKEGKK